VQDDDFRAWYRKEWDKRLGLLAISLDLIGLKKAGEDFRYWEAMQKRVGSFESTSGASIGMHESLVIYSPDREKMRK
jgi:hypothetical protein